MISKDDEKVGFAMPFEMRGAVENWLNDLVGFMRKLSATSLCPAFDWRLGSRPSSRRVDIYSSCEIARNKSGIWTEGLKAPWRSSRLALRMQ